MHISRYLTLTCFLILWLLLSACSSTHQAYLRTLQLAFEKSEDIKLASSEIMQSPVDLVYVKKGDFSTVVMALAFIDDSRYQWVSADNVSLIEQHGRMVKTLALPHNLDFLVAQTSDPLADALNINDSSNWERLIDINHQHFGVKVRSSFKLKGSHGLQVQEREVDTVLIEEMVKVLNSEQFAFSETQWLNQFWVSKKSGRVIRSKQKAMPDSDYFDITYVSRALRL